MGSGAGRGEVIQEGEREHFPFLFTAFYFLNKHILFILRSANGKLKHSLAHFALIGILLNKIGNAHYITST